VGETAALASGGLMKPEEVATLSADFVEPVKVTIHP